MRYKRTRELPVPSILAGFLFLALADTAPADWIRYQDVSGTHRRRGPQRWLGNPKTRLKRQAFGFHRLLAALVALATTGLSAWPSAAQPAADSGQIYARIDVDALGPSALQEVKATPGLAWWVELDDRLLVLAGEPALAAMERRRAVERLAVDPEPSRLYLLRGARRDDLAAMDVDVLASGGRYAVIQARNDQRPDLPARGLDPGPHAAHATLRPFEPLARLWHDQPGLVLASQQANRARPAFVPQPQIAALVDEVDAQRWFDDVVALADFNRYTHGTEIDGARDWLVQQLETLPGLAVSTESFQVGSTTAWNVIATLPGTVHAEDLYIVGAHYDATSQAPPVAAPGAEDNASGCAGVLEMARIFAAQPPAATVLFICYSGEEQGLFGSRDHASSLVTAGLDDDVKAVLIMDMVGFTADDDLDCLLETSSANAALAEAFAAAADFTDLRIVISFNPFGSDHVPYLNRGMPALLAIENDWNIYPCYHRTCDLPANITLAMGREILRMNVAAMGRMSGFGPIFADGFESGDSSAWTETTVEP